MSLISPLLLTIYFSFSVFHFRQSHLLLLSLLTILYSPEYTITSFSGRGKTCLTFNHEEKAVWVLAKDLDGLDRHLHQGRITQGAFVAIHLEVQV